MDEGEISHEELQKLTLEECREQSDNVVKILQADEEAMDEAPTFLAKEEGKISDKELQTSTPLKLLSADQAKEEGKISDEELQTSTPLKLLSADQAMDEGEISHEELQKLTLEECREQSDNVVKILQADEEAMDEAPTFLAKEEGKISDKELQTSTPLKLLSADQAKEEGKISDEELQTSTPLKLLSADQAKEEGKISDEELQTSTPQKLSSADLAKEEGKISDEELQTSTPQKLSSADLAKEEGKISDEKLQTSTPQNLSSGDQAKEEGKISDEKLQTSTPQNLSSADQDLKEGEIMDETVQKFGPQNMSSADQVLLQNIKDILDSLTPFNIQLKMLKLEALQITNQDVLQELVNLLLEKAVGEPSFSKSYAELCHRLRKKTTQRMEENTEITTPVSVTFRKLLLNKCQEGFEKNKKDELDIANRTKEIEETPDVEKKKEHKLLLDEDERKIRRKSVGLVKFIGELYKLHMLTPKIMHGCIGTLLSQVAEEPLECLCVLLSTIGKELERESAKKDFDKYFASMAKLAQNSNESRISSRIRFMLQDVIELRQKKWRDENAPKTIEQIRKDAERDAALNSMMLSTPLHQGRNPGGRRRNPRSNQDGDRWQTSGNKYRTGSSSYAHTVEPSKLQHFKQSQSDAGDAGISVGGSGGFYQWTLGASSKRLGGGGLAETSRSGPPSSSNNVTANRFALIKPDSSGSRKKYFSSMGSEHSSSRGGYQDNREATEACVPPASVPDLDEDEGQRKADTIFDEWCANNDAEETLSRVNDTFIGSNNMRLLVRVLLNKVIEGKPHTRTKFADLLVVILQEKKLVSKKDVLAEFHTLIEIGDDMVVDIPFFWSYFGQIFSPLISNEVITFDDLREALDERPLGDRAKVVAEVFKTLNQNEKKSVWTSENRNN